MTVEILRAGVEVILCEPYRDPPRSLRTDGRLFVDTLDGRRLHATGGGLGAIFAGGLADDPERRVSRAAIERAFTRYQRRATGPAAAPEGIWDQLRDVLERETVVISEEDLLAKPFVVEISREILAAINR
jgi:hypothetical protein